MANFKITYSNMQFYTMYSNKWAAKDLYTNLYRNIYKLLIYKWLEMHDEICNITKMTAFIKRSSRNQLIR